MKWGKVVIDGMDELQLGLNQLNNDEMGRALKAGLNDITKKVWRDTAKNTPRVTGHLARSWRAVPAVKKGNSYVASMYNTAEYGMYVEYGHRTANGGYVEGRYMLTNTVKQIKPKMGKIMELALKSKLKLGM